MNPLALQDSFEPYYAGRKSIFATIEPAAVERARAIKDRIERARKVRETADEDAGPTQ